MLSCLGAACAYAEISFQTNYLTDGADVLEDARVHLLADCGVLEVLVFEDPVEVVQLVLDLLELKVVDGRDLDLADDLEARVAVVRKDLESDVEHVVAGRNARMKIHQFVNEMMIITPN